MNYAKTNYGDIYDPIRQFLGAWFSSLCAIHPLPRLGVSHHIGRPLTNQVLLYRRAPDAEPFTLPSISEIKTNLSTCMRIKWAGQSLSMVTDAMISLSCVLTLRLRMVKIERIVALSHRGVQQIEC